MKRNPSKKSSLRISLSPAESSAIIDALDFMSMCETFTFENQKFTIDHVDRATYKAQTGDTSYTRSELRAVSTAIDFTILCLSENPSAVAQVKEDSPELIAALDMSQETLISLRPRFHAYLAR